MSIPNHTTEGMIPEEFSDLKVGDIFTAHEHFPGYHDRWLFDFEVGEIEEGVTPRIISPSGRDIVLRTNTSYYRKPKVLPTEHASVIVIEELKTSTRALDQYIESRGGLIATFCGRDEMWKYFDADVDEAAIWPTNILKWRDIQYAKGGRV